MSFKDLLVLGFFDVMMVFYIIFEISMENNKKNYYRVFTSVIAGTFFTSFIGNFVTSDPLAVTLNLITVFIIIKFMTNFKIEKIVVIYSFSLSIIYAIQIIIALMMKSSIHSFEYSFKNGFWAQLLALLLVIGLVKLLPIRESFMTLLEENRWVRIFIINIFVIYYMLVMLWHINFTGFIESIINVLLIISILLAINIILIRDILVKQSIRQKMLAYDTYLPIVEEMIDEIRNKQHDYHNHIQTLQSLNFETTEEEVLSITAYRKALLNNEAWENLIAFDSKVLMAFLFSKYNLAQKKEVTIAYHIKNYLLDVEYSDYELIEIMGILLDNALEATIAAGHHQFDVIIDYKEGKTIIETQNICPYVSSTEIKRMFEPNYSTKNEKNHGVGLSKLEKILKKENGTIVVHYDTTRGMLNFCVELL